MSTGEFGASYCTSRCAEENIRGANLSEFVAVQINPSFIIIIIKFPVLLLFFYLILLLFFNHY